MADTEVSVVVSAVDRLTAPLKRMQAAMARITAPVRAAGDAVAHLGRAAGVDALGNRFRALGGTIMGVHGHVTNLTGKIAGLAGLGGIGLVSIGAGMLKQTVGVSAQFEKFETILTTLQGSSAKAKESMNWIADFAAKTPYELAEVTDSFVKLKSYGIDPMDGTMKAVGDAAAAMGKPIDQVVEALADGVTGEMERLKELGIKSSTKGDIVSMAFTDKDGRQRTFQAAKTDAKAMQKAILAIFAAKGFNGAMDNLSKTWDGMWSNLMDGVSGFWRMIGDAGSFDFLKGKLQAILDLIQRWKDDGTLQAWAQRISDTFVAVFTAIETKLAGVNWGEMFTVVQGAVEGFVQTVRDAVAWIGGWENAAIAVAAVLNAGLIGGVLSLTGAVVNLGIAFGAVAVRMAAMAFGPVIAAVGNFVTAIRAGYGVMAAFNLVMAANPIGLVITAVAALAGAAALIYANWETVGPWLSQTFDTIAGLFSWAFGGILDFLLTWSPVALIARAVNAVVLYFTGVDLFAIGSEWIAGLIDGIKGKWGELTAWLSGAMQSLTGWLPDWAKDKLGVTAPTGSPNAPAPANDASSAVTRVANTPRNTAAAAALAASMAAVPVPVAATPAVTALAAAPATPAVTAAANPGKPSPGAPVPGHKPAVLDPSAAAQTASTGQAKPAPGGAPAVTRTITAPVTVSVVVNGLADVQVIGAQVQAAVQQAMADWQARQGSDADAALYD